MIPLREVDLLGIFVTPASLCLPAGVLLALALRRLLDRIDVDRFVWSRPLFDLSLLVGTVSLLILSLGSSGWE